MSHHIQTQTEWESTMARRIMDQLRGELYLDQRYLNAALGALPPAPLPPGTTGAAFAADGARLCYPPAWVLATYRKNRRYLPRAYLHSVLHCIFRHLWLRGDRDRTLWGLACDIAVENTLDSLNTPATTRPVGWLRQQAYQQLQQQCGLLAAGPIYRALRETDDETLTQAYSIHVPATLTVDQKAREGEFSFSVSNLDTAVSVEIDSENGFKLVSGDNTAAYVLSGGNAEESGGKLVVHLTAEQSETTMKIAVDQTQTEPGDYTDKLTFSINIP